MRCPGPPPVFGRSPSGRGGPSLSRPTSAGCQGDAVHRHVAKVPEGGKALGCPLCRVCSVHVPWVVGGEGARAQSHAANAAKGLGCGSRVTRVDEWPRAAMALGRGSFRMWAVAVGAEV